MLTPALMWSGPVWKQKLLRLNLFFFHQPFGETSGLVVQIFDPSCWIVIIYSVMWDVEVQRLEKTPRVALDSASGGSWVVSGWQSKRLTMVTPEGRNWNKHTLNIHTILTSCLFSDFQAPLLHKRWTQICFFSDYFWVSEHKSTSQCWL